MLLYAVVASLWFHQKGRRHLEIGKKDLSAQLLNYITTMLKIVFSMLQNPAGLVPSWFRRVQ
jgi:hypothetical protein